MGRKLTDEPRYKIIRRVTTDEPPLMIGENLMEQAIRTFYVNRQRILSEQEKSCERTDSGISTKDHLS